MKILQILIIVMMLSACGKSETIPLRVNSLGAVKCSGDLIGQWNNQYGDDLDVTDTCMAYVPACNMSASMTQVDSKGVFMMLVEQGATSSSCIAPGTYVCQATWSIKTNGRTVNVNCGGADIELIRR